MGEADDEGRRNSFTRNLSLQMDKYPRDLLQRFMSSDSGSRASSDYTTPNEETQELELNLGLSLGGRFGVDKSSKKLIRSSSIAGFIPHGRPDDPTTPPSVSYHSLMRASSLPTETEEEWRKRKELQTLRRMEAKRRRSEKQRNSSSIPKVEKEEERRDIEGQTLPAGSGSAGVTPPFGLASWAQAVLAGGVDSATKGKGGFLPGAGAGADRGLLGFGQQNPQGSAESQGGSSSGTSEWDSKSKQGSSSGARSPVSCQLPQERGVQDTIGPSGTKKNENSQPKRPDPAEHRGKEIGINAMEDMPCVFTKGDGPNGRRIEGILYKYGKGEEVRIMCVCHGSFLSPAEFVKHAGGGDVTHPLRHIVINPNPTFSR